MHMAENTNRSNGTVTMGFQRIQMVRVVYQEEHVSKESVMTTHINVAAFPRICRIDQCIERTFVANCLVKK